MFANCQLMGMNDAIVPDICWTTPPVPPAPLPYPNMSLQPMAVGFAPNVLFMGGPGHNLATVVPISFLDLPGFAGLLSGTVMGATERVTCAPNVLVDGIPGVRFLDMTLQNTCNTVGMTTCPSQVKVLML